MEYQFVIVYDDHFRSVVPDNLILSFNVFLMHQWQWDFHCDGTADILLARQFNLSIHHIHQVFHDRQSQAESVFRCRIAQLPEGIKDLLLFLFVHSGSGIMHGDKQHAALITQTKGHRTGIRKLQGIGQQVSYDPLYLFLVAQHDVVRRTLHGQHQSLLVRQSCKFRCQPCSKSFNGKGFSHYGLLPVVQSEIVQQIIEHLLHTGYGFQRDIYFICRIFLYDTQMVFEGCQRDSQLMGDSLYGLAALGKKFYVLLIFCIQLPDELIGSFLVSDNLQEHTE